MPRMHRERHRTERIGWLRAAVLGANDGIVSTASLVIGVAAASAARGDVLIAGVAGLVAGAMSMAAGEYVSVKSQADTEAADLARERGELAADAGAEHRELAGIYVKRGLDAALADQVATQLMEHDALGAHARDELGISETLSARPVQAALSSAASFIAGAALPLLVALDGADGGSVRRRSPAARWCSSRPWARWLRAPAAPRRSRGRGESRSGARSQWPSPPLSAPCSGRRWPEARTVPEPDPPCRTRDPAGHAHAPQPQDAVSAGPGGRHRIGATADQLEEGLAFADHVEVVARAFLDGAAALAQAGDFRRQLRIALPEPRVDRLLRGELALELRTRAATRPCRTTAATGSASSSTARTMATIRIG